MTLAIADNTGPNTPIPNDYRSAGEEAGWYLLSILQCCALIGKGIAGRGIASPCPFGLLSSDEGATPNADLQTLLPAIAGA